MSEMSESATYPQQISFSADFLASHTVQPGSEKAQQMTVISGRNISALLTSADPIGLLVKMCLESEQPYSTKCYLTWKVWNTPQSHLIFRLAASMPHTYAGEFSLLPTPKVARGGYQYQPGSKKKNYTLEGLAQMGMLPTPQARDWKGKPGPNYKTKSLNEVITEMEMLPTPTANRWSGLQSHGKNAILGPLNPEFVEWLMGFPIGWTELEPSEMP
jgi:hypothetical protein